MESDRPDRRERLRDAGRRARASLSVAARDAAADVVADTIAGLDDVRAARRVMVTRAIGDELDLAGLERRLRRAGVVVSLPVVVDRRLVVVDVDDTTVTRPGWGGVPEPVGPPADGPVDVVVVPALALDRHGRRLGYGGGHYDRFLAGPAAGAVTIGAVFHAQLVREVPTEPHDVTLQTVVTEDGVWRGGVASRRGR